MSGREMMFSHKNSALRRKYSSCSWKQWCCIIFTIYCCLNHSAYGQLPSALTTTAAATRTTTTTTKKPTATSSIISTTKTITPRVIVESIAVDEHKKPIKVAGNDEADEKTAAEILQLPHAFRHQQHYSHRIEQAVNDFKQQHEANAHIEQQKQQESHLKERDKIKNNNKKNINDKNTMRYHHHQQSQAQWQDQQHHQRRHEHHTMQQQQQQQQQPHHEASLYHLRHRNHYAAAWEKQSIPTLRHQRHRNTLNITTIPTKALLQQATTEAGSELDDNVGNGHDNIEPQVIGAMLLTTNISNNNAMRRYFDRQALLYRGQPVTESPIKRWPTTHSPLKWRPIASNQLINNDSPDSMYADASNGLSGKRLTLKVQDNRHIFQNYANMDNVDIDIDDDDDDDSNNDDDDDDYSYEQPEEDFFMSHELATDEQYADKWNNFPTSKPPVKRYTNPFKSLFKSLRSNDASKYSSANKNNDDIPDEKYRLRVQQHHMRQQKHRKELEAMRSWHGGLAANTLNTGLNKHTTNSNSNRNHNHQDSDSLAQNYIPGSLTPQKEEDLGTLELTPNKENTDLAISHMELMLQETACRNPQPRIVPITGDTSKSYTPHCTVLHRCADDTGCCSDKLKTCAPKHKQKVHLYFFVRRMYEKKGFIERRTFVNHTECHCVEKTREKHNDDLSAAPSFYTPVVQQYQEATVLNCNCPNWFEKILQDDGSCRCDCSSGNTSCERFKSGLEHFSIDDRKCMKEGRCKPPTCEYGAYIRSLGVCPRLKRN